MKSIRSVYKIGHGPSSSHTVGPYNAARRFGMRHPEADRMAFPVPCPAPVNASEPYSVT